MKEEYKRLIERELTILGRSPETVECYISCLKLFMNSFKGKCPNEISLNMVKAYIKKLKDRGQSHRYINIQIFSIKLNCGSSVFQNVSTPGQKGSGCGVFSLDGGRIGRGNEG